MADSSWVPRFMVPGGWRIEFIPLANRHGQLALDFPQISPDLATGKGGPNSRPGLRRFSQTSLEETRRPRFIRRLTRTAGRSFSCQRQGIIQEQFPRDISRGSCRAWLILGLRHQFLQVAPDFRVLAGIPPGGVPEQRQEHLRRLEANRRRRLENPLIIVLHRRIRS